MEYITLANGYQLPMLGYGTLHIPPKQTKECVLKAKKQHLSYIHFP